VLWDRQTRRIVSNNFPDITLDLDTQFGAWANPEYDLYPEHLRPEIDELNELVYVTVNNGVYRSGFAATQESYHEAVTRLFATLDLLEARLSGHRYLLGDAITEADVRLWVTLARFDAVYYSHFKCNLRRVADFRLSEPLVLCPRPVRAARLPRHHEVRPDQAPLLHHPPEPEPDPDRPGWAATRLDHAARPRAPRRPLMGAAGRLGAR
jgi:hypothetical protein